MKTSIKWLIALLAIWQLSSAGWIHAKAWLAQQLIAIAWEKTQSEHAQQAPWPWADTWPVAKIGLFNGQNYLGSWYVLKGSEGNALAFAPGWMQGTAMPGVAGTSIIAAHRDTQFSQLNKLQLGDNIELQNMSKQQLNYRVTSRYIVDSREQPLQIEEGDNKLMLITCYPFNAIRAGGPLRYVVEAQLIDSPAEIQPLQIGLAQPGLLEHSFSDKGTWF